MPGVPEALGVVSEPPSLFVHCSNVAFALLDSLWGRQCGIIHSAAVETEAESHGPQRKKEAQDAAAPPSPPPRAPESPAPSASRAQQPGRSPASGIQRTAPLGRAPRRGEACPPHCHLLFPRGTCQLLRPVPEGASSSAGRGGDLAGASISSWLQNSLHALTRVTPRL